MATDKGRFFDCVSYWERDAIEEALRAEGGAWLCSPFHDGEVDKKPHHHVMYWHGNSTTLKHARSIFPDGLAANGHIEIVKHPVSRMRYYLHLDDPEKQQFSAGADELLVIGDFPLDLSRQLSPEEKRLLPKRVVEFIRTNNVTEYKELVDSLMGYDEDMFQFAYTHTIFLSRYLDSQRYGGRNVRQ